MGIRKMGPVIAIDGPAGTGKSSVTKRLCESLGFVHVDTGALYRCIAFISINQGVDFSSPSFSDENKKIVIENARNTHLEFKRNSELNPANRILANGKDLTAFIRTPEVSMGASRASAIAEVRASLLGLQRQLGCVGKSILEGRDIGTVIFPDADVKFFLTASVNERAKRRLIELESQGKDPPSFEEVKKQMIERDTADSSRAVAPLKKADDAIEFDTSDFTLDEVVQKLEAIIVSKIQIK